MLAGVRKGGPAQQAGLRKGDIVTHFDGVRIQNLYDLTEVLRGCAPGDVVDVEFLRGDRTFKTKATLVRRRPR